MNCDYCRVPLSKDGHCKGGCGAPGALQAKRVVPPFPKNTFTDQYGGTIKEFENKIMSDITEILWDDTPQFSDIFALISFVVLFIMFIGLLVRI